MCTACLLIVWSRVTGVCITATKGCRAALAVSHTNMGSTRDIVSLYQPPVSYTAPCITNHSDDSDYTLHFLDWQHHVIATVVMRNEFLSSPQNIRMAMVP